VADPILGQAVKAIVVRDHDRLSEKDVLRHCQAYLEDYMVPKYVEFVDQLPKSMNGKISKSALSCQGAT
jgi:acyl-CoA synthetase (AMP-forming)/AMP-acid ligase II